MKSSDHPDVEALSAHVDGEAPEWADHVAACAACRASADQLRAVAAAVGGPVEPPSAAYREIAVIAALDDLDRRHAAEGARSARRRWERRWTALSAAAVIAAVLGFSAILALGTRSSDQTTVAGPALESTPMAGDVSGSRADAPAAASAPPADLGDVADAATLLARARAALAPTGAGPTSSSANAGASRNAAAPPNPAPTAPALTERSPAPAVVGTRPCEEQARTREPALGPVVYYATARRGQVPAVALGFGTGQGATPVTLLLLAQDGCAELLRAAGP